MATPRGAKFKVVGAAHKGSELHRVKGRNSTDNGVNVDWDPTADGHYGDPRSVTVGVSFGDGTANASVSETFTLYPGRLHPFAGEHVFHSSWVAEDRTAKSERDGGERRSERVEGYAVVPVPKPKPAGPPSSGFSELWGHGRTVWVLP